MSAGNFWGGGGYIFFGASGEKFRKSAKMCKKKNPEAILPFSCSPSVFLSESCAPTLHCQDCRAQLRPPVTNNGMWKRLPVQQCRQTLYCHSHADIPLSITSLLYLPVLSGTLFNPSIHRWKLHLFPLHSLRIFEAKNNLASLFFTLRNRNAPGQVIF